MLILQELMYRISDEQDNLQGRKSTMAKAPLLHAAAEREALESISKNFFTGS